MAKAGGPPAKRRLKMEDQLSGPDIDYGFPDTVDSATMARSVNNFCKNLRYIYQ